MLSGSKTESGRPGKRVVRRKSCGGVDEVAVGRRHVRQRDVPVGLFFVANHGEHLGQYMLTRSTPALVRGW